jgi:Putative lumazine-binding
VAPALQPETAIAFPAQIRAAAKETAMPKTAPQELTEAVQRYLDLMYDGDVGKFDSVFAASSQLHGFREGKMTCWPAAQYEEVLAGRTSPKALGSGREEQILLLDFASPTQALAKVRVRINDMVFVDYLSYHRIGEQWLINSKAYHREA